MARQCAWTAQGMLADLKGFGSQVDLSACFVERSCELLATGGTMALILPSKLMRALYGGGLRRLLTTRCTTKRIVELDDNMFPDATTYPCLIVANKGQSDGSSTVMIGTDLEDQGQAIEVRDLPVHRDDLAAPWIVGARRSTQTARLMQSGTPIACRASLPLSRGVMTGLNEAFILAADGVVGPELDRHLLPVVRGGDIRPFDWRIKDQIVWTHDRETAEPLPALPPSVEEHLLPYRSRLLKRADLRRNHAWWRLFRSTPGLFGPKVAWRDIGRSLCATALPAEGEDRRPIIPLNTVYYLSMPGFEQAAVMAAWMNSRIVRDLAASVAERASGGYLRFFSWVVGLLPLPTLLVDALHSPSSWNATLATDPWLRRLLEMAMELHSNPPGPLEATPELDDLVESLYNDVHDQGLRAGRLVS